MSFPDFVAATEFVWTHARVLDRHRFAHAFLGGSREPVLDALAAYRNADGGYGNALEPDCRAPVSQPVATTMALTILDEVGDLDAETASGPARWFSSVLTAEGALPFCLADVAPYPRAPWWNPEGDPPPPNLNPTGAAVGWLRRADVAADWMDRAEEWCWDEIDRCAAFDQYKAEALALFVVHAADTERAARTIERLCTMLAAGEIVSLDAAAEAREPDAHTPLQLAPRPDSVLRPAFDDTTIDAFLDRLASGQAGDGGWTIDWPAPGPAAVSEWRAIRTIEALETLRAYGRT